MCRPAVAALVVSLLLLGCSRTSGGRADAGHEATAKPTVANPALDGLLRSAGDLNSIMGTTAITPGADFTAPRYHSYLRPEANCLGAWVVGERAVYGESGLTAIRGQVVRQPTTSDADWDALVVTAADWDSAVVEAVASYPSAGEAQKFFTATSDRWSKCANHRVNITINNERTTWKSGELTKNEGELTMPITRWAREKSCQRALSIRNDIVVDVAACATSVTTQAEGVVSAIQSKIPS
jgi:hypothetical protein